MLKFELLKNILIIAIASGIITTLSVQKIKEQVNKKRYLFFIAFAISMTIGTLFAKCFSSANWLYCIWCGFFTWIDADILYKSLEDKVFKSFSLIEETKIKVKEGE